jgi:hypothetical protein
LKQISEAIEVLLGSARLFRQLPTPRRGNCQEELCGCVEQL